MNAHSGAYRSECPDNNNDNRTFIVIIGYQTTPMNADLPATHRRHHRRNGIKQAQFTAGSSSVTRTGITQTLIVCDWPPNVATCRLLQLLHNRMKMAKI